MSLNNVVIEIDEVEYLITPESANQITIGVGEIYLHRLVDNNVILFSLEEIKKAISKGVVDQL